MTCTCSTASGARSSAVPDPIMALPPSSDDDLRPEEEVDDEARAAVGDVDLVAHARQPVPDQHGREVAPGPHTRRFTRWKAVGAVRRASGERAERVHIAAER